MADNQTELERLQLAARLEERRTDRAEALAAETARLAATVFEHERRLNAVNGHIREFITQVNANKVIISELVVEFKALRKDINEVTEAHIEREQEMSADRRSIKQALYALLVALTSTGVGAVIYELVK